MLYSVDQVHDMMHNMQQTRNVDLSFEKLLKCVKDYPSHDPKTKSVNSYLEGFKSLLGNRDCSTSDVHMVLKKKLPTPVVTQLRTIVQNTVTTAELFKRLSELCTSTTMAMVMQHTINTFEMHGNQKYQK